MARLVWVAVGAAGGIYAYKRATAALEDARERGVVGNVNAAATTASAFVGSVRQLVTMSDPAAPQSGARVQRRNGSASAMRFEPYLTHDAVVHHERTHSDVDAMVEIDLRRGSVGRPD